MKMAICIDLVAGVALVEGVVCESLAGVAVAVAACVVACVAGAVAVWRA